MLEPWAKIIHKAVKPALLSHFILVYINFDAFVRRSCKETFGTSKRIDLPANLPLPPPPPLPLKTIYWSNMRTIFSCGLIQS